MKSQTVLRTCVLLQWAFFVVGIALTLLLHNSLPPQLRDWRAAEPVHAPSVFLVIITLMFGLVFISGIVASIGLLLLKRWAAWLFLYNAVLAYSLMACYGPTVEHGAASAVNGAFSVFTGLILGVAFFTDALNLDRAKLGAVPNGGPTMPSANSGTSERPPSVS